MPYLMHAVLWTNWPLRGNGALAMGRKNPGSNEPDNGSESRLANT